MVLALAARGYDAVARARARATTWRSSRPKAIAVGEQVLLSDVRLEVKEEQDQRKQEVSWGYPVLGAGLSGTSKRLLGS